MELNLREKNKMHFDIVKHDSGFTIYLDGEKIAETKLLDCNRTFFSCDFTENELDKIRNIINYYFRNSDNDE